MKKPHGRPIVFTEDVKRNLPLWLEQGETFEQIAVRIGSTPASVKKRCYGFKFIKKTRAGLVVSFSAEIARKLQQTAQARALRTDELVKQLINVVCTDDLFAAVLDGS